MFTCLCFSEVYSAVQYLSLSTKPWVADTYILLMKTCNQERQIVSLLLEYPKIAMVLLVLLLSPLLTTYVFNTFFQHVLELFPEKETSTVPIWEVCISSLCSEGK